MAMTGAGGRGMTADERDEFLTTGALFAKIGTTNEEGWPMVSPVWYTWDGSSFLVIAGVIGTVVIVAVNASRRRASAPTHTTPWEAPTVEGPEADVEQRVRDSEGEGMTPATEERPVDIAKGSGGEAIVSELAAPGAAEELLEHADDRVEMDLDVAAEEGMTPAGVGSGGGDA